ncbi:MAG: hypothetical protein EOO13_14490, partial [Chitinophagaceae bacterium]
MEQHSLLNKWVAAFVAGLTSIALILSLGNSGSIPWLPPTIVFTAAGLALMIALIFPFIWHYWERRQLRDSTAINALLHNIIRYGIAFNLAIFGWRKIFGLQFVVDDRIASLPMNQQSGEWLTWYYFGYSPVFGTFLALFQIAGAYLLLFPKTFFPAAISLLVFMLNLTFINICYHMNMGALVQSVLLTIGLAFLCWPYRQSFILFIKGLPAGFAGTQRRWIKNIWRISAILGSL